METKRLTDVKNILVLNAIDYRNAEEIKSLLDVLKSTYPCSKTYLVVTSKTKELLKAVPVDEFWFFKSSRLRHFLFLPSEIRKMRSADLDVAAILYDTPCPQGWPIKHHLIASLSGAPITVRLTSGQIILHGPTHILARNFLIGLIRLSILHAYGRLLYFIIAILTLLAYAYFRTIDRIQRYAKERGY